MGKNEVSDIEGISNELPRIEDYWFVSDGATPATISGILINRKGKQVGASFTTTLNAGGGAPKRFSTVIPGVLPSTDLGQVNTIQFDKIAMEAVGAIVNITGGAIRFTTYAPEDFTDRTGATLISADFTANWANYPRLGIGDNLTFGSVGL